VTPTSSPPTCRPRPLRTGLVDATADHFDGLSIVVNNAVASPDGHDARVGEMDTDYWEDALRVNLTAPMWLCRAAIPHLRSGGHGADREHLLPAGGAPGARGWPRTPRARAG